MMMNPQKKVSYTAVCNLVSALEAIQSETFIEECDRDTKKLVANLLKVSQDCKVSLESTY